MGCLFSLVAVLTPRLVLFFIWLLTNWFTAAYQTVVWPVLGFFFMPYTTLAYMGVMLKNGGAFQGWWLLLFIVAVVVDVAHLGDNGRRVKKKWK